MKMIKYVSNIKNAIMLPYGIDTKFDEECDNTFLRALDWIYYLCLSLYVFYAAVLLIFLVF